ncbi:MAG: DUF2283 domain-containing protein [Leptospiraceae bacterium]|nr:DUF2283 domain-containing protein [Leptospiraceae bacterium]
MKLEFFKQSDTLYIEFKIDTVKTQKEISKDMVLDLDEDGSVIGIEIEYARNYLDLHSLQVKDILDIAFKSVI